MAKVSAKAVLLTLQSATAALELEALEALFHLNCRFLRLEGHQNRGFGTHTFFENDS